MRIGNVCLLLTLLTLRKKGPKLCEVLVMPQLVEEYDIITVITRR